MQVIGDCIPFDNPKLPILHHIAKHAPQSMKNILAFKSLTSIN